MIDLTGEASFLLEPLKLQWIAAESLREEFDRHAPPGRPMLAFVHHAHAAGAKFQNEPVFADGIGRTVRNRWIDDSLKWNGASALARLRRTRGRQRPAAISAKRRRLAGKDEFPLTVRARQGHHR